MKLKEKAKTLFNFTNLSPFLFFLAVALRFLLFLFNPPTNAFDNHFKPIYLIMQTGSIPAKDACWQCYQPPVFYIISAFVGKIVLALNIDRKSVV